MEALSGLCGHGRDGPDIEQGETALAAKKRQNPTPPCIYPTTRDRMVITAASPNAAT